MIIIVDYGMGNLFSVKRAAQYACPDKQIKISDNAKEIEQAEKIILPGQGAMKDCMLALNKSNLKSVLIDVITGHKKPILGICVGMQMLFESSEEGDTLGLGILKGHIKKFPTDIKNIKVPHMGWNTLQIKNDAKNIINPSIKYNKQPHIIWENIPNNSYFYFIHSYYLPLSDDTKEYSIANCEYGVNFIGAVAHSNIIATQFHPEKSADVGLQLYKNFFQHSI